MAVREFNGTTDNLIQGLGAATSMTFGTAAMLLKFSTVTSFRSLFQLHDSSNTFVSAPMDFSNFGTFTTFYSTGSDSGFSASTGPWYLVVIRKATGTSTPRYSIFNFTTSTWSHGNHAGGAEANGSAPGAGGRSGFAFQGTDDFFGGRVAMRAAWSNSLPWTADASGDSALVAAGLHTSAANWVAANPSVAWKYDQASTGTAVDDIASGGAGTQISITGTTVINGDDPPGFDFALTTAAAPAVGVQRWPALGNWPRPQQQIFASPPPGATTSASADVASATGTAFFDASGGSISLNLISDGPIDAVGTAYDATISTANATNAAAQLASGTSTANSATVKVSPVVSAATGSGVANNATSGVAPAGGLASATGTAGAATVKVSPVPTAATGSGTAIDPTVSTGSEATATPTTATGTGVAQSPTAAVAPTPGSATGSGSAQQPSDSVAPVAGVATATGTGNSATSKVSPAPTTATATGVANDATGQTGSQTNATASTATGTGAAQPATGKVSPTPSVASATGTANAASAGSSVNVQAGLASASGAAPTPAVTRGTTASAGVATAIGSVSAVSLGIRAAAEAAAALAVALTPAAGAFLPGTAHAATGTAPDATAGSMTVPTATGG